MSLGVAYTHLLDIPCLNYLGIPNLTIHSYLS
nr:hypothetical protein JOCKYQNQ_JOCKYQNQ_CDS_0014 [Autographiviridae sp.]